MFKKGDYLTCNGKGFVDKGVILVLHSDVKPNGTASIEILKVGTYNGHTLGMTSDRYQIDHGMTQFRLATVEELKCAGIIQEPIENAPSSQIQFQSKTCGGTTYMQRMMHRIIELRKYHEKPRLTVMVLKGEMQQEVVNRVKKDVALLRKYTGYSSFITVRKEK